MTQITLTTPDDLHLHLRDGDILQDTVPATARSFHRATVMPNLTPPVVNAADALAYRERIMAQTNGAQFEPVMTLYLTNETTAEDISEAREAGIIASKLYPAGATTNSDAAVDSINSLYPVFERMSEVGMLLLVHGEVTDPSTDIFDRERLFIEQYLEPLRKRLPELKIVLEHITTADAVDFVEQSNEKIAATITPQHLLMNRNDMLVGGIKPHNYCLPVLKRNTHQLRLQEAATSGNPKFFLGSDSAPHVIGAKESACGCAGCYSAPFAIELYTEMFDELNALDKLEAFSSFFGADFYGIARNQTTISLHKEEWIVPERLTLANGDIIVPFYAGKTLNWKLSN